MLASSLPPPQAPVVIVSLPTRAASRHCPPCAPRAYPWLAAPMRGDGEALLDGPAGLPRDEWALGREGEAAEGVVIDLMAQGHRGENGMRDPANE